MFVFASEISLFCLAAGLWNDTKTKLFLHQSMTNVLGKQFSRIQEFI